MRMKSNPLTVIMTSAYLSAMLTSGVAPIRADATLAAAVDPTAAQNALKGAIASLDAAGWAAAVAAIPSPEQTTPKPVPVAPEVDPVMTDELMARLLKLAEDNTEVSTLSGKLCAILDLCDGSAKIPVKSIQSENPPGHHLMVMPGRKEVIILHRKKEGEVITFELYLTDKTYKLRAAAISITNIPARRIPNEKAAEKFKAELSLFAKEAADLPPTGTAVAGNS